MRRDGGINEKVHRGINYKGRGNKLHGTGEYMRRDGGIHEKVHRGINYKGRRE